jgi:hypothetical protein
MPQLSVLPLHVIKMVNSGYQEYNLPRFRAAAIRTHSIEVSFFGEKCLLVGMLLALHRKPIVHMALSLQLDHQWSPNIFTLMAVRERIRIANHNQSVPGS